MTEKKTAYKRSHKIELLVLIFFFLSGLTGLIYEILWTRLIVELIGGTPFAISIVLTVFMGGLGLGSYLAGRTIDRVKKPMRLIRIYGILELIIGIYALAIPVLLAAFKPLYAIIYNRLFEHFMLYNVLTFIGCSVILCVPVICMGATLPVLCRFYVTKLSHLGTHAGRLYGLNTIGAAMGALLCGFWLISIWGVMGTLIFAVLINVVIGFVCILASYKVKMRQVSTEEEVSEPAKPSSQEKVQDRELSGNRTVLIGALIIFGVSGFCGMAYEVIWTKLLALIVAPTTYSFTIVLVTFITGLALGSMIFGRLADKSNKTFRLLIFTQINAALFVLGISQLLGNSQFFFTKLIYSFGSNFLLLSISKAVILLVFMILPTLCLGATFPLVGKIYTQTVSKVGRSLGFAYAINTIGAVLGSFCAGFVLIPLVGKEKALSIVIMLQLLTSLVIAGIVLSQKKAAIMKKRFWPVVPALAGLILCFYFPMWNRHILAKGKYHRFDEIGITIENYGWLETLFEGPEILAKLERSEVVYYGDGIGGFTTVLKYTGPFGEETYSMVISGKADASSRADMQTQTLLAHFGMLFHKDPRTVMVLGLASGITAGEVLYYPVEQVDVIDINPQVVKASDFFLPWNNNVLSNSKTNLIIQDAIAHLRLTRQKYDVIISEPSNPWMAGLASLFTHDFFVDVKDRLNEDGIFVQFIISYEMDWPTFSLIGRTFAQVFPNSILVSTDPSTTSNDYLLVGFKGKGRLALENAQRKLAYTQRSTNVTLLDAKLLYRLIVSENLQKLFGQGPVNTDNRPRLEFAAPKLMHLHSPTVKNNILSNKWLSPTTNKIINQVKTDVDAQIDFAAYALKLYSPFQDMVDLSKATATQKGRFFELLERYCAGNPIDFAMFEDDELRQRCISIQRETLQNNIDTLPDKAISYFYLANLYYISDMMPEAIIYYLKLLEMEPGNADAHSNLGYALMRQDRLDEAVLHLNEAVRIKPNLPQPHNNLGHILAQQNKFDEAIIHFKKALRIKPDLATAHNDLGYVLASQGRLEEAIRHFEEAVRIKPDFTDAQRNLKNALLMQGKRERNYQTLP